MSKELEFSEWSVARKRLISKVKTNVEVDFRALRNLKLIAHLVKGSIPLFACLGRISCLLQKTL